MEPRLNYRCIPNSIFAIVKPNHNHFECAMHTRKTLEGAIETVRKGKAMTQGHNVKIYELHLLEENVVYVSNPEQGTKLKQIGNHIKEILDILKDD